MKSGVGELWYQGCQGSGDCKNSDSAFVAESNDQERFMAAFDNPVGENGGDLVEVRLHLQDIARSEITRHRNRLASLTSEQQSAVEALLISTADLISQQVIVGIQSYPEAVRTRCVSVWGEACAA
jgi:hypothetical protein